MGGRAISQLEMLAGAWGASCTRLAEVRRAVPEEHRL